MKHRVYLRALEANDYLISHEWRNDPEIQESTWGHKYFVSKETEKNWVTSNLAGNEKIVLAICLTENDKYIGNVYIEDIDWINRTAHVPILIGDKKEWNKGYATEARLLALKYAFDEKNIHRVVAYVIESNQASIRMNEKCGFVKEGVMRQAIFKSGQYHNLVILGCLRDEFHRAYKNYFNK